MILPGHIALAILGHRILGVDLKVTVASTLMPDVVDKTAGQLFHFAPSGRYAMHSLAGLAASTAIAWLLGGRKWGKAWAVGHMLHFLGDGGEIPWLLPLKHYHFHRPPALDDFFFSVLTTAEGKRDLLLEFALLGLAILSLSVGRDKAPAARKA